MIKKPTNYAELVSYLMDRPDVASYDDAGAMTVRVFTHEANGHLHFRLIREGQPAAALETSHMPGPGQCGPATVEFEFHDDGWSSISKIAHRPGSYFVQEYWYGRVAGQPRKHPGILTAYLTTHGLTPIEALPEADLPEAHLPASGPLPPETGGEAQSDVEAGPADGDADETQTRKGWVPKWLR